MYNNYVIMISRYISIQEVYKNVYSIRIED